MKNSELSMGRRRAAVIGLPREDSADRAAPTWVGGVLGLTFVLVLLAQNLTGMWATFHRNLLMVALAAYALAVVARHSGTRLLGRGRSLAAVGLFLMYWGALLLTKTPLAATTAILLPLTSLHLLMAGRDDRCETALRAAMLFVLTSAAWSVLYGRMMSWLWVHSVALSRELSASLNGQVLPGPTAGLFLFTIHALLLAGAIAVVGRRRWLRPAGSVAGFAILLNIGWLLMMDHIPPRAWHLGLGESAPASEGEPLQHTLWHALSAFDLPIVLGGLLAALLVVAVGKWTRASTDVGEVDRAPISWRRLTTIVVGSLVVAVTAGLAAPAPPGDRLAGVRIGWYCSWDEGYPTYSPSQSYGLISTGMYGVVRDDLQRRGVTFVDLLDAPEDDRPRMGGADAEQEIPFDLATDCDLLILLVRSRAFSDAELAFLSRYLQGGGQVLIVGDHTNLSGCQFPFNQLTSPHGITLEFDSAFSFTPWWFANLRSAWQLGFVPETWLDFGVGTGGSLSIDGSARPLLTASYAFGDLGNVLNSSLKGAFLGDYTYQHGEALGDMVLAAEARVGKGRIVALGDSSQLQNIAYARSGRFVRHLLAWMISHSSRANVMIDAGLLLGMLTAIAAATILPWRGTTLAATAVLVVLFVVGLLLFTPSSTAAIAPPADPKAILLDSGQTLVNRDMFKERSYLALPLNLNRLGYDVSWSCRLDELTAEQADLAILPAPARSLRDAEAAAMERFVQEGGILIVTAGRELAPRIAGFLDRFGLAVADIPLGGDAFENGDGITPSLVDAWQLCHGPDARVLFRRLEEPVVVCQPAGRGYFVLIGDSHFFSDGNLEEEKTHRRTNIRLFRVLMSRLAQGELGEIDLDILREADDRLGSERSTARVSR